VFAGADFGAGVWDLLAGGTRRGRHQRDLIEHSLAPVWEANHVWLIFVLVVLWTGSRPRSPRCVHLVHSADAGALGMIARGSAFAFRKTVPSLSVQRFSARVRVLLVRDAVLPRRRGRRHRVRPGSARHRGGQRGDQLGQPTSALAGCWPSVSARTSPRCCCARTRNGGVGRAGGRFRARR
jgi:hypothetical protein